MLSNQFGYLGCRSHNKSRPVSMASYNVIIYISQSKFLIYTLIVAKLSILRTIDHIFYKNSEQAFIGCQTRPRHATSWLNFGLCCHAPSNEPCAGLGELTRSGCIGWLGADELRVRSNHGAWAMVNDWCLPKCDPRSPHLSLSLSLSLRLSPSLSLMYTRSGLIMRNSLLPTELIWKYRTEKITPVFLYPHIFELQKFPHIVP